MGSNDGGRTGNPSCCRFIEGADPSSWGKQYSLLLAVVGTGVRRPEGVFGKKKRCVEEDLCSFLWSVGNGRGPPIFALDFLKVLRLLLEIRSVTYFQFFLLFCFE